MIGWTELTRFLYILARISGFILFNPMLGRRNIPNAFRVGMTLVLSVFTASMIDQAVSVPVPVGIPELAVRMLLELAVGVLLGMVANFFFYIPQLAGSIIDTQMGMTMNQIYDSGSRSNMSVTGTLLNTLMILLFFAAGGHHTLLRIMITSGEIVGYGGVSIGNDVTNLVLELFIECTVLAVKMCMPVLAAELIGQLGMGVLMKVIPQINVFSINIELKVLVGLALLVTMMSPFSEVILETEQNMLNRLHELLVLMG